MQAVGMGVDLSTACLKLLVPAAPARRPRTTTSYIRGVIMLDFEGECPEGAVKQQAPRTDMSMDRRGCTASHLGRGSFSGIPGPVPYQILLCGSN